MDLIQNVIVDCSNFDINCNHIVFYLDPSSVLDLVCDSEAVCLILYAANIIGWVLLGTRLDPDVSER